MKKLLFILLMVVLSFVVVINNKETKIEKADFNSVAKAIILVDAETGKVIYEENSAEALPIASLSKLMTQYLVLNAIKNGALSWESTYEPSDYVQQTVGRSATVKLGMTPGNSYSVKELFTAMTVISANDAAIALAEMVSGTEEAFADLMNKQADSFALKETTFFNASGLDGDYIGKGYEQTNRASARDVAVIAKQLIANHPEVLDFTKLASFKTDNGTTLWSTNLMLAGMPQALFGIDGLKTGFTDQAGSCFAGTGVFDGRRIISVVLDVEADGKDAINPKFNLTRELIEQFVLD
ncbi:D-alanyl-D-alanine carboxypeptidase family protein [Sporosarcina sp. JAI121]|uniref:D-alanyl-D-alanine carboxypeptidase family protein n=1 Tax=Sporosarcina sp. JAI121 TaxID=2723064 RepID=UPI0015C90F8F|nr:D-alanyl-D-alanine carboxypeptidase family protein [Sporosarcina sp. JAI121]NYF25671.1 D-alanyl-D-alanine carboxypeptidase (penicillin-binding protein 5/6) [Sporosarcina sp. JAI121]